MNAGRIKVLEFTREPKKDLEKSTYFDTRKATVEITKGPFLWFMKPKVTVVKVYKPYAKWKYADTGDYCDTRLHNFLDAYEELNDL